MIALVVFAIVFVTVVPSDLAVHKHSRSRDKIKASVMTTNDWSDRLLNSASENTYLPPLNTSSPKPSTFDLFEGWRNLLSANGHQWHKNYPTLRHHYYISWYKRNKQEESASLLLVGGLQSSRMLNESWIYASWSNSWQLVSSNRPLPTTYAPGYQVLPTLCQTFVVLIKEVGDVWYFSGRTETWTQLNDNVNTHFINFQNCRIEGAVSTQSTRRCSDCVCFGSVFLYGRNSQFPDILCLRELQCNETRDHRLSCHWPEDFITYNIKRVTGAADGPCHKGTKQHGYMAAADDNRGIIYFSRRCLLYDFTESFNHTFFKYNVHSTKLSRIFATVNPPACFKNIFVWSNYSQLVLSDLRYALSMSHDRQKKRKFRYWKQQFDEENAQSDVMLTVPSLGPVRFHWFEHPRVSVYRAASKSVYRFPFDIEWFPFPPRLSPGCLRFHTSVYAYESQNLYIYGGLECNQTLSRSSTGNMWRLSISSKTWWLIRPQKLPKTYISNCGSYSGSNVVLFGGRYENGGVVNDLWLYSTKYRTWTERKVVVGSWPEARAGCSLTASSAAQTFVLFGGYLQDGKATSDVWLLSLHSDKASSAVWKRMSSTYAKRVPTPRYGHSGVMVGSELVIYGGIENSLQDIATVCLTDMWAFNLSSKTWRELVSLPAVPRLHYWNSILDEMFDSCNSFLLPYGKYRIVVWEYRVIEQDLSMYSNSVWMMNLATSKQTSLPSLDRLVLVQGSGIWNGSLVYYGRSVKPPSTSKVEILLAIGKACPYGFAQLEGPADVCTACPIGHYSNYVMQVGDCLACPRGSTTTEEGASSITNCSCDVNYCEHGNCQCSSAQDNKTNIVCKCPLTYTGERCETMSYKFLLVTFGVFIVLIVLTTIIVCCGVRIVRHRRSRRRTERELEETRQEFTILPQEIELLGRLDEDCPGGYGQVHKAKYRDWFVAVKQLQLVMAEWVDVRREFLREIQFMRTVRHPNIVMFLGAGQYTVDHPFLVLEFMSGGALRSLLQDKDVEITNCEQIGFILDTAEGVRYLHTLKPPRIHRDLKSANLLLSNTKSVKVSDFGSACLMLPNQVSGEQKRNVTNSRMSDESESLLREETHLTSRHIGTARWRSPELWRKESYGTATDVYSFGVVAWEIVTRQTPFTGENYQFDAQVEDAVLAGIRPAIPDNTLEKLRDLIESCWEDNSINRPQFGDIVLIIRILLQQLSSPENSTVVEELVYSNDDSRDKQTIGESSESMENRL